MCFPEYVTTNLKENVFPDARNHDIPSLIISVVAHAFSFGNYEYFSNLHGLLPQPPHVAQWFIGSYIDRHHLGGLTGYEE